MDKNDENKWKNLRSFQHGEDRVTVIYVPEQGTYIVEQTKARESATKGCIWDYVTSFWKSDEKSAVEVFDQMVKKFMENE